MPDNNIQDNNGSAKNTGKLTTTHKILIAGIILILATVGVAAAVVLNRPQEIVKTEAPSSMMVVDDSNVQEMEKFLEQKDEHTFVSYMSTEWIFDDLSQPSSTAQVGNNTRNTKPFYFDVILAETGEIVFTSPVIPVGSELRTITLDKQDLEAGTYEATVTYNLMNAEGEVDDYISFGVDLIIR